MHVAALIVLFTQQNHRDNSEGFSADDDPEETYHLDVTSFVQCQNTKLPGYRYPACSRHTCMIARSAWILDCSSDVSFLETILLAHFDLNF